MIWQDRVNKLWVERRCRDRSHQPDRRPGHAGRYGVIAGL
jgi:hypothetical protein